MPAVDEYIAVGRRKTSVARVRMLTGKGAIIVNKKPVEEYFTREVLKTDLRRPLEVAKMVGNFDIKINVNGGGPTGQAGAIRHGISRALLEVDPELRPTLKAAGFLKRDPRMKERKKYGQKGARARFQFSKR
ncbi:SSU ribosomal protein S9p (S16e) [hydrothermal vent metagenome]|uniref:SSU ribosomal protein S9p (S16e) n=1 Tax=hydrothermal vent metagenome TaxID=652676 RepID=A0A3B0QX70_9ZZZZ